MDDTDKVNMKLENVTRRRREQSFLYGKHFILQHTTEHEELSNLRSKLETLQM